MSCNVFMNNTMFMYSLIEVAFQRPFGVAYYISWTGLDWLVKRGVVKRRLVKLRLVKRGLVKLYHVILLSDSCI